MTAPTGKVRIKTIALPAEHGGWGFLLEPIALGLLVAGSLAGVCLAIAGVGAFLSRHPLRLLWLDRRRSLLTRRTTLAQRFALLYAGVTVIGSAAALAAAETADFILPLALAVPAALAVMLLYDAQNRSRKLIPELVGPLALGALAPAIAMTDGWQPGPAFALYIRPRLRLERGRARSRTTPIAAHLVAAAILAAMVASEHVHVTILSVAAQVALTARAAYGLSPYRKPVQTRTLGSLEVVYGAMVVIAAALGHALKL